MAILRSTRLLLGLPLLTSFFISGSVADPLGTTGALPLGSGARYVGAQDGSELIESHASPPDIAQQMDKLVADAKALSSLSPPSKSDGLQTPSVSAAAKTMRVPANLHTDFSGLPDVSVLTSGLDELSLPVDASLTLNRLGARSPLVRRESTNRPRHTITSSAAMRENLDESEDESQRHRAPAFQGDPNLTPESIFANKQIAPEIAEFLGHMAQRNRVHHKEERKSAREAGLMQGQDRTGNHEEGEDDDSDDIEDMKRAAASGPKKTALSQFFSTIDTKTTAGSWIPSECAAIAGNVTHQYLKMKGKSKATWATSGPAGASGRAEIHLGMFFRHWKVPQLKQVARKLRLGVLSFLATQDAGRVKLHIWTDLDNHNSSLREILGPIAYHPEMMDAINITQFDPKAEFAKIPPTFAKETLKQRYKSDELPNLRPDLIRSVILYNYGGLWMDADTVLLKDVAPLLGEDWAYLVTGKQGAIEGALLSASRPASHFANEYLISYVMRQAPIEHDVRIEQPLLVELFQRDPSHTSLHALPPCFFDGDRGSHEAAVLASDAKPGSAFFENVVTEPYRANFAVGIRDAIHDNSTEQASILQSPAFQRYAQPESDQDEDENPSTPASPSFAYHWRSNYEASWVKGSLADVAERTFMKKLNIQARP